MRLPFIQVAQEALTQARGLARLLKTNQPHALGLLNLLWAWALTLGDEDKPPDGVALTPHAPEIMAGSIGWDGDSDALLQALIAVGAVEKLEIGLRVKGMDRYAAAWEKAQKDRDRKRKWQSERNGRGSDAEKTRKERGSDAEFRGQTQTQTQTQIVTTPRGALANASPGLPPLIEQVASVFKTERGHDYAPSSADEIAGRELLRLAAKAPQPDLEISRRWQNALRRKRYPTCSSLRELARPEVWNAAATEDTGPPLKATGTSGRATDADKDHSKPAKTIQTKFGEEIDLGR